MDLIFSIFTALFVAVILVAALTFGFALFIWLIIAGIVISAIMLLRQWWQRWRFMRGGAPPPSPKVIEADYRDISDDK